MKCFMYFFTRSLLFTGQLSCFDKLLINFSLSLCSFVQSYSRWSTVWFPLSQGHSGDSIISKRCRYVLVSSWAVTIAEKFSINLILVVSLSLMIGNNSVAVNPSVVLSHWICHLAMLFSLTCWAISLLGILLRDVSSFLELPLLACQLVHSRSFLREPLPR